MAGFSIDAKGLMFATDFARHEDASIPVDPGVILQPADSGGFLIIGCDGSNLFITHDTHGNLPVREPVRVMPNDACIKACEEAEPKQQVFISKGKVTVGTRDYEGATVSRLGAVRTGYVARIMSTLYNIVELALPGTNGRSLLYPAVPSFSSHGDNNIVGPLMVWQGERADSPLVYRSPKGSSIDFILVCAHFVSVLQKSPEDAAMYQETPLVPYWLRKPDVDPPVVTSTAPVFRSHFAELLRTMHSTHGKNTRGAAATVLDTAMRKIYKAD